MTTIDLLCAIGEADESFVDEAGDSDAEAYKEPVHGYRWIIRWSGLAAMFLVLIGVAWLYANGNKIFHKNSGWQESSTVFTQESVADESAIAIASEGSAVEMASEESAVEILREEVEEEVASVESAVAVTSEESIVERAGQDSIEEEYVGIKESAVAEGVEDEGIETVMISSFAGDGEGMASTLFDDIAVEEGSVFMSASLSGALAYYGDQEKYRYRVLVELFQDGVQIANDGEAAQNEMKRLVGLGYIVAVETIFDGETTTDYFTLHATAGQMKNFTADAELGYALWLYDERVKGVQAYE